MRLGAGTRRVHQPGERAVLPIHCRGGFWTWRFFSLNECRAKHVVPDVLLVRSTLAHGPAAHAAVEVVRSPRAFRASAMGPRGGPSSDAR